MEEWYGIGLGAYWWSVRCARMADMSMKMRHQERLKGVGLAALVIIAGTGLVAAAAIAPGAVAALAHFAPRSRPLYRSDVDRSLKRLLRKGFVEEVLRGRVVHYRLTDRGREHLMRCELARTELTPPKKWDGKWRLVAFDVKEKQRRLRDDLRLHLTRLGLYPIQKSVWLYPHPCDDLVRLIKVDLGLGRNVQYFTTRSFPDREEEKLWRLRFDV